MEEAQIEVVMDEKDIMEESERICRWAAARAGVIIVAPVVGTMALMANEIYMIMRLAKLRGITLSDGALFGFLGSLGATFVGQTVFTLIPFAPIQMPLAISVTYAVGEVATAWLKAGQPEDIASFKSVFDEAKAKGMESIEEFKNSSDKDIPLGDEKKRFNIPDADSFFDSFTDKADFAAKKVKDFFK